MSSFYCDKCGAKCSDTERGYVTGCKHYPVGISIEKYNALMSKIIAKSVKWDIDKTLIALLDEANKYVIKEVKREGNNRKRNRRVRS